MAIYQSSPNARPDSDYEPGTLSRLVAGNQGRMLDPRRTPVSVVEVQAEIGFVLIRVEGFEDEGATWQIPLERYGHYQFERGSPEAPDADVAEMERAITQLARDQEIGPDEHARARTDARIDGRREEAHTWLDEHSRFLAEGRTLPDPSTRRGDPLLAADLERYLEEHGLQDIEHELARSFVSNPGSGEIVKGHRIVLAELGLADYSGGIVRDPATFEGAWTRVRRTEHIIERLAFVRALFARLGIRAVDVWRGTSIEGQLEARTGRTFVSTTFDESVARNHYEGGSPSWTHVLVRQDVPIERLFMTYHETAAMNTIFLEAEAVLFARPGDGWP